MFTKEKLSVPADTKLDFWHVTFDILLIVLLILFVVFVGFAVFCVLMPAIGGALFMAFALPEDTPMSGFWVLVGFPVAAIDLALTAGYLTAVRAVWKRLSIWHKDAFAARAARVREKNLTENRKKH